jgi:hypothetical protein
MIDHRAAIEHFGFVWHIATSSSAGACCGELAGNLHMNWLLDAVRWLPRQFERLIRRLGSPSHEGSVKVLANGLFTLLLVPIAHEAFFKGTEYLSEGKLFGIVMWAVSAVAFLVAIATAVNAYELSRIELGAGRNVLREGERIDGGSAAYRPVRLLLLPLPPPGTGDREAPGETAGSLLRAGLAAARKELGDDADALDVGNAALASQPMQRPGFPWFQQLRAIEAVLRANRETARRSGGEPARLDVVLLPLRDGRMTARDDADDPLDELRAFGALVAELFADELSSAGKVRAAFDGSAHPIDANPPRNGLLSLSTLPADVRPRHLSGDRFNEIDTALRAALARLRDRPSDGTMIDITGGVRPFALAAAVVSLDDRDLRIGYVMPGWESAADSRGSFEARRYYTAYNVEARVARQMLGS